MKNKQYSEQPDTSQLSPAPDPEEIQKERLNVALDEVGLALEKFGKHWGAGNSRFWLAREELRDATNDLKAVLADGAYAP